MALYVQEIVLESLKGEEQPSPASSIDLASNEAK
jgi:hypothetical protein